MLVCPGCHVGLSSAIPVPPAVPMATQQPSTPQGCNPATHWFPITTTAVTPTHFPPTACAVQPPYVCGRMLQIPTLNQGVAMAGLGVPHNACHVLCCLACPHVCPALRLCDVGSVDQRTCVVPDSRTSLHTSGGGLLLEGKQDNSRSVSPETKVNYPVSLNPFVDNSSAASDITSKNRTDSIAIVRQSPSPSQESERTSSPNVVDSEVLTETRNALEESGWYYGPLSGQQAATMLQNTAVGTFLLRDSASSQCLYSLSVQTSKGPTSVRIHYSYGKFRLDCTGHNHAHMPEFNGVVQLVQHYIHADSSQVWVDHEGKTFSPIKITKPLRRTPPSLQHLCRLSLNSALPTSTRSALPSTLRGFLDKYPNTC